MTAGELPCQALNAFDRTRAVILERRRDELRHPIQGTWIPGSAEDGRSEHSRNRRERTRVHEHVVHGQTPL